MFITIYKLGRITDQLLASARGDNVQRKSILKPLNSLNRCFGLSKG